MTSTSGRRPGPVADPSQRRELLAAASRLLATEGPGALTVRRIAAEAGYSTMGVYSRFGGKDGIVEALFIEGFEALERAMRTPETGDAEADLVACGVAYRRFALDHPTSYAIMFERAVAGYEPSLDAATVAYRTFELLRDRSARAVADGYLPDDDPSNIAQRLWAMSHGWVSLEIRGMLLADAGDEGYVRALYALYRFEVPALSAEANGAPPRDDRASSAPG